MSAIILPDKRIIQPTYPVRPNLYHPLFNKCLAAKAAFPNKWLDLFTINPSPIGSSTVVEPRSGMWVVSSDATSNGAVFIHSGVVPTAELSLIGLISFNSFSTAEQYLSSRSSTGNGVGLRATSSSAVAFRAEESGGTDVDTGSLTYVLGQIQPFAATVSDTTSNFYLGGQVATPGSNTFTSTTLSGSQNLYLGKRGTAYRAASLGLILFSNRVISLDEYNDWRAAPWQIFQRDTRILYFSVSSGGRTGTLAATETGSDTASISGDVLVKGALAATESGADSAALAGKVLVEGALSASESGADTAALAGDVLVKGALAAAESGNDTASFIGEGFVPTATGTLAASESGSDTASIAGKVYIAGTLSAVEGGLDGFAASGNILVQGTLAASETGDDTAAFSQEVLTLTPADLDAIAAAVWADPRALTLQKFMALK